MVATLDRKTVAAQPGCHLLKLSPEIRQRIYSLALQTYCDADEPYAQSNEKWKPDHTGPRRVDTALLRTCRAIYIETWATPLLQTTLVIHEGSIQNRPPPGRRFRRSRRPGDPPRRTPKPGQVLFHLQAWQLLLIQRVDMTFQQIRLEGGGMGQWLRRLHEARRNARSIVNLLATRVVHRDAAMTRDVVQRSLLDDVTPLQSLTIRLNRMDWWTWSNDPSNLGSDLEVDAWRGRVLRLQIDEEPFSLSNWEEGDVPLFGEEFEFVLKLETFGVKAPQLDRVVRKLKKGSFVMPRMNSGLDGKVVAWDGEVVNDSFDGAGRDRAIDWVEDTDEGRRIAVRTIRFVPKVVL